MASTLFAEPPKATMEEARDHFLAAERIKVTFYLPRLRQKTRVITGQGQSPKMIFISDNCLD